MSDSHKHPAPDATPASETPTVQDGLHDHITVLSTTRPPQAANAAATARTTPHDATTFPVRGMAISLPQPGEERLLSTGLYTRGAEISRGGMGRVSYAWDHNLQRQVAIKEMLVQHGSNDEARQRFLREAYIAGGLEHPGTVPVHHFGVGEDGVPFYTMKYIAGRTLESAIQELDTLRPSEANFRRYLLLQRVLQACQAIAFAHTRGVIHRDIKPSNIMLGDFGETVILDWGIAKTFDSGATPVGCATPGADGSDPLRIPIPEPASAPPGSRATPSTPGGSAVRGGSSTQAGEIIGTPAYMAPEQARGELELLGPASDVFSLGATLYTVVTGQSPYGKETGPTLLDAAAHGKYERPRRLAPDVPRALETIILRAMAPNPARRYPTACELAEDLERFLAGELVRSHRYTFFERAMNSYRRHRLLVLTILLLGVGTNAAGLLFGGLNLVGSMSTTLLWIADAHVQKGRLLIAEWYRPAASALGLVEETAHRFGPDRAQAEPVLASIVQSIPNVELLYYAWDTGTGLPASIGSDPARPFPEGMDVRTRPWHVGARAADGGVAVTKPYADVHTGLPCVTVSRLVPMPPDPATELVVATDLHLEPLLEYLRPTNLPEGGAILVTAVDPALPPRERWIAAEPVLVSSTLQPAAYDAAAADAPGRLVRTIAAWTEAEADLPITARGQAFTRANAEPRARTLDLVIEQMTYVELGGSLHAVFTAPVEELSWEVSAIVPVETLTTPFFQAGRVFLRTTGVGLLIAAVGVILYRLYIRPRRRPGGGIGPTTTPRSYTT